MIPALPLLSVHDTAPVVEGSDARTALHRTLDLAALADTLGYTRYWVAEHHGMRGVASCAPAVLVAEIARTTRRIRAGAGGVLLPSHPPLVVAEQFGTLEALHPGRIDLALGRAPGGPRRAADRVRPDRDPGPGAFRADLAELAGYFAEAAPDGVRAVPAFGNAPSVWVLGSGPDSALPAGELGLPYAFGGHLNPAGAVDAVHAYRRAHAAAGHRHPSYAAVSVGVIAADTDDEARYLARSQQVKVHSRRHGRRILLPDPEDAARLAAGVDPAELAAATEGYLIGGPERVRDGLAGLARRTGADELIVTGPLHGHAERRHSYRMVAGC